jgi:hypothetical protein
MINRMNSTSVVVDDGDKAYDFYFHPDARVG